jgi:hypothetical protein
MKRLVCSLHIGLHSGSVGLLHEKLSQTLERVMNAAVRLIIGVCDHLTEAQCSICWGFKVLTLFARHSASTLEQDTKQLQGGGRFLENYQHVPPRPHLKWVTYVTHSKFLTSDDPRPHISNSCIARSHLHKRTRPSVTWHSDDFLALPFTVTSRCSRRMVFTVGLGY